MEEQGVSRELMALPGGDSRLRAYPGHHSPCLRGSPPLCPSLLPAGQMLESQIAEMCSSPPGSFLLLDALRPRDQVSRGWLAAALLDSFACVGGEGISSGRDLRALQEEALDGLFVTALWRRKDSPFTSHRWGN